MVEQAAEDLHLARQQATGGGGQAFRRPDDRGMGAVRGAEGVVDVGVLAGDEAVDERLRVRLLARVEAEVVEQLDAGHEFGQAGAHRGEVVAGVGRALRPAEVGADRDVGAVVEQPLQGRDAGADAEVVRDDPRAVRAVGEGDVQVGPDEDPLAVEREQVLEHRDTGAHDAPTIATRSTSRFE